MPRPTTRTANATTSHARVTRRRAMRVRTARVTSGVGGMSSSRPRATRACSSSVIRLPEPLERTRGARLDRAFRDAERLCDLLLAQAGEIAERDHETLVVRQLVDRRKQRAARLEVGGGRLGGRGRVPRGLCGGGWEGKVRAAPRRAAAVARLVRDDAEQPRLERRTCAEAAERAPRLDEPFLRRILGFARAAGDQKRSAICDRLVCVHELSVGVMVAASGALDQLRFVEWT